MKTKYGNGNWVSNKDRESYWMFFTKNLVQGQQSIYQWFDEIFKLTGTYIYINEMNLALWWGLFQESVLK